MIHKKYDIYGFRIKPKSDNISNMTNLSHNTKKSIGNWGLILGFMVFFFIVLFACISAYIAWYCYANDLMEFRIAKTFLATMFFYLYLPYFVFLRVFMKVPCL